MTAGSTYKFACNGEEIEITAVGCDDDDSSNSS